MVLPTLPGVHVDNWNARNLYCQIVKFRGPLVQLQKRWKNTSFVMRVATLKTNSDNGVDYYLVLSLMLY